MIKKMFPRLILALLLMGPGLSLATQAAETGAPAALPAWLVDDPADPAMMDDGSVKDGDMRLRSTGLCRAELDPRSSKRIYVCEYKTSEACVEADAVNVALTTRTGGKQHVYYCPAPNH